MEWITLINKSIMFLLVICLSYQYVYMAIRFLKKDKPHREAKQHRFAVLISARNEEKVIGTLLDSIRSQSYPSELVDIYVVADNCTDATARISEEHGADVLERFNRVQVGKGYALRYLLENMEKRGLSGQYDGYFVFDADNVLDEHYIEEMNRSFSDGWHILTSYRNSKNFGDNWISAGCGLWFLRESEFLNRSRMLTGNSCKVSGTGFLFHREILEKSGGWNFFLLTEDIEFSVDNIVRGEKIGYCRDAIFYDEQPVSFVQSWNQRLRWAKGALQVFWKYKKELLTGIVKRWDFSCFDMTMVIAPTAVLTLLTAFGNVSVQLLSLYHGKELSACILSLAAMLGKAYLVMLLTGAAVMLTEWKRIHMSTWKKILYTFTFPVFSFTFPLIAVQALVAKVQWTPIEHNRVRSLQEIRGMM